MTKSRRNFLQKASLASAVLGLGIPSVRTLASAKTADISKMKKPNMLKAGDLVGLISPSGAIYESEPYEIAQEVLENFGLRVKPSKHLHDRYGHLAGLDQDRADEINNMFSDEEVKGIFCLRGGSGAARVLDLLDYKAIAKNPKPFIGYSDITAFHMAFSAKANIVSFHGPLATSDWNSFAREHMQAILFEGQAPLLSNPGKSDYEFVQTRNRIRTITSGKATGVLAGGNLSVLTGLVGTEYLPKWKGKILFIEEVGEKIYRVDRMMSQLKLAGILNEISGFVFGKCTKCDPGGDYGSLTLEEVVDYYIKPLGIPAYSGAMIGHIDQNFTIPIGIEATMDADNGTIQLNEPSVI